MKSTTLKQHCPIDLVGLSPVATTSAESRLGFVEVIPPPAWALPTPAPAVDLQRADGARLRIHCQASPLPLAALIRTFLETH